MPKRIQMSPQHLRPVESNLPPLTPQEMQERGNEYVTRARVAAVEAIRVSMLPEFIQKGRNVNRVDILRWRFQAREAIAAWREVESVCTELLNDLKRTEGEQ